jgi:2'-5' RNA ligase
LDTFEPSNSSDGKVPVIVPANIPGIHVLRNRLEDLSASEHKSYIPHVTLAYCEPGEELPPPHHEVPISFTHLTVRRGNTEAHRFPFGG